MFLTLLHNPEFLAGLTITTLAYGNKVVSLVVGILLLVLTVVGI